MRVTRLIVLLCGAALAGCAAEGGVTGSGISASITGNVSLVQVNETPAAKVEAAAAELPFPVRVSIDELPGIESITDEEGNFELSGDFSGRIVLLFASAETDMELGMFDVEVPAGSVTVLENIEILPFQPDAVTPAVVRQFDVFGHVALVECEGDGTGTLLVDDEAPAASRRQFLVRILADTEIVSSDGLLVACQDIDRGARLVIEGVQRRGSGTIFALLITLSPSRPPTPVTSFRPVSVNGHVTRIDCEAGFIEVEESRVGEASRFRQPVLLSASTEFRCGAGGELADCQCPDIGVGDRVAVDGQQRNDKPRAIAAGLVIVGFLRVKVVGVVFGADCEKDVIGVRVGQVQWRIELLAGTDIRCLTPTDVSCECDDALPGDRVEIHGTVHADRPRVIEADLMTVRSVHGVPSRRPM